MNLTKKVSSLRYFLLDPEEKEQMVQLYDREFNILRYKYRLVVRQLRIFDAYEKFSRRQTTEGFIQLRMNQSNLYKRYEDTFHVKEREEFLLTYNEILLHSIDNDCERRAVLMVNNEEDDALDSREDPYLAKIPGYAEDLINFEKTLKNYNRSIKAEIALRESLYNTIINKYSVYRWNVTPGGRLWHLTSMLKFIFST